MNREEIIQALRAKGYDGPISYTKSRLEIMLEVANLPDTNEAGTPPPANADDAAWEGEEVKLSEWHGLKGPHKVEDQPVSGTVVKVEGLNRKKFEFLYYYRSSTQEYVAVRGPLPGHGNNRYIEPHRILHGLTRKPILK